ncbi:MAG: phosphopyruvate hydratase, partial [Candidatus Uhrbacteria bacterium]|nr:phosphopyruvate hydratase [Candidatus Uhrbacteria bacterium]
MFNKNKIVAIVAREILDSRGNPTVACCVTLGSGVCSEAKVPSGASTGTHEALELRDGGKRYGGKGVLKAVAHVNDRIAPLLKGIDVSRQQDIDHVMIELDGTPNKSSLGANAMLSVSLACAQANALAHRMPLWKSLRSTFHFPRQPRLPIATMNVLNGGAHAGWVMDIQECMIVPKQRTFAERLRAGAETFQALKKILKDKGFAETVGDEGGFAPKLPNAEASFDLLITAIRKAGYRPGKDINLATDVAASEFYDRKEKLYRMKVDGKNYTSDELLARYQMWQKKYPFESIEDPFAEDDWGAWKKALPVLKKKSVIVGDDFLVTNVTRLQRAIKERAANAILIKPNQIGTLTETVEAIVMAHEAGWETSISHRSGETSDTTIADLAVACGSKYIKTGSLSRSERVE